jgi:hypothetical protein
MKAISCCCVVVPPQRELPHSHLPLGPGISSSASHWTLERVQGFVPMSFRRPPQREEVERRGREQRGPDPAAQHQGRFYVFEGARANLQLTLIATYMFNYILSYPKL